MAEVGAANGDGHDFAFTSLQRHTAEALQFLDGTGDIHLRHLFGIAVGSVGERKADVESLGSGLNVQVAICEGGIGETIAERIGWGDVLLLIPTITYEILLCIVCDEFLTALIAAIAGEVDEDVALSIILDGLRLGTCGVSRHILQFLGPGHWQFARR